MAQVDKKVLVEHSCARMYALVEAVEHYPQFLPWCAGASVDFREANVTRATLHIDYHHARVSFATENTGRPHEAIDIRLLRGPFRQLHGTWRFTPLGPDACKIELRLAYEFSSRLLEKLVGPVFNYIANNLVDAFVRRAEALHGRH